MNKAQVLNFYDNPDRIKEGQKPWTVLGEGPCLEDGKIITAIIHTWAFNSIEAVRVAGRGALSRGGMTDYRPIALFSGHHYCVLPADFTHPLPNPDASNAS